MTVQSFRVGLVGAGYIATWHLEALRATPGATVTAVCDPSLSAAKLIAQRCGGQAFANLDDMLSAQLCDVVHILTPPHLHCELAVRALEAGMHVYVEKPFTVSAAEARSVLSAAEAADRRVGINHNFLGLDAYKRLKTAVNDGTTGPIDSADIVWRYPLPPLRSGPYGMWMLREPRNLLLELGPHLFAFAIDLFGPLENMALRLSKPLTLPGGVQHYQGWDMRASAGRTDVSLRLSLTEGVDDRSVTVRGVTGLARLDFARDTLIVSKPSAADIVIGPLKDHVSAARQQLREGGANAVRQLLSLNIKSPYALGFQAAIGAFYEGLQANLPVDERFSAEAAVGVTEAIEKALEQLPAGLSAIPNSRGIVGGRAPKPSILVIGGTGFIGRYLTRKLADSGSDVRVLSRGHSPVFADIADKVEIFPASLQDTDGIAAAMAGIDVVYHLAKTEESTWDGYLQNDVAVTERLAEVALAANVRRFIYTGTIASYDASLPHRPINEDIRFDTDMSDRNLYARSKALCERRLLAMHEQKGLPLVIARPGIVVGRGGPLQHWGIGRWSGAGSVMIWGDGRSTLPFVLVDDVADALVLMSKVDDIEGQSFNLIGEPMLSAQDYFGAIHSLLGARIRAVPSNMVKLYLADLIKYGLKRFALKRTDVGQPSLRDWRSRATLSPFLNERAKSRLGWKPEHDRKSFLRRAIAEADLFGF